ncbi:MAG: TonB family protein [Candidatus Omnitrophica bacterium]|nr:TonB family protein [Candidatus Omnitrophota bacterium]
MDRVFLQALFISFLGHLLLLFPWQDINPVKRARDYPEIEINYFEIKPKKEEMRIIQSSPPEVKKIEVREEHKEKESLVVEEEKKLSPQTTKEEEWVKRDFTALSKEPAFLDYYRAIREKIKISANRKKPLFFNPGEVCVFFVLDNRGNLRRLKIIEQRSSNDPLLRETALRSIERASPFPPFPKELKREQIAFNIVIAFEVR